MKLGGPAMTNALARRQKALREVRRARQMGVEPKDPSRGLTSEEMVELRAKEAADEAASTYEDLGHADASTQPTAA